MTITLTRYNLDILNEKARLFNYLNSFLPRAYFKISKNTFTFMLKGQTGVYQINLEIPEKVEKNVYFSVDYNKWQIMLQKFGSEDSILLETLENSLKVTSNKSSDYVNLGIIYFKENSSESTIINRFLESKKGETAVDSNKFVLNEETVDALDFADNLFNNQSFQSNSIGLSRDQVIYADRAVVLKINLQEPPSRTIQEDDMAYIHSSTVKLINLLVKTSNIFYFDVSKDFGAFYWEDNISSIYMVSEDRKLVIPTEEEFEGIKPQGNYSIEVVNRDLKKCLSFFLGFYDGSAWKPAIFNVENSERVIVKYYHPSAEIMKSFEAKVEGKGNFILDSETLRKILVKTDEEELLHIFFDEKAPGILIKSSKYEAVISKLEE